VVNYPGHKRVTDIRVRLSQLRQDTRHAVEEASELRREVDAIRAEVKRLTVALGDQLADQSAAIEELARRTGQLEATARSDLA
jgi:hypothetical protein